MIPKIGRRLTDAETRKVAVMAAYIDASPHEWPKGMADIALLCHGYLDLQAELAEARKDGERKGIAAWLTDNHVRTKDGKLCCVEVRRPDTHGGMACTWKMSDFDIQAEMDGCEVGEEIVLRYVELTDAEFTALGDFDGW